MVRNDRGFTIVELLIVIVVIGILAAITVVAFTGVQGRAKLAGMQSDMSTLNKAIQLYKAENGTYPITPSVNNTYCNGGWCGFDQATGDNFIPGLAPKYIATTPQLPTSNPREETYVYRSPDGTEYKLARITLDALSASESSAMASMMTNDCDAYINTTRWGYWSSNASRCW